ncbi:hypothetical protein BU15DRAFT_61028 [Melanogaster broomeanus]|nr:hypothetical protein BU15DRAFT_61028 [Melanogaster broomeanus]
MTIYTYIIACGASLIPRGAVVDAQTGELKELVPLPSTGISKSWEILDWNIQDNSGLNNSIMGRPLRWIQTLYPFRSAGLFGDGIGFQRPASHINVLPLSFATAASVIVLGLAVHMTHMDKRVHPLVSNTGVLDVLWLSSRLPELTERFATVEKPSADSLRAAGKFNVCLAEPIPSTEYQDSNLENAMKVDDGRGNERGHLVSSQRSESDTLLLDDLPESGVDDLKRDLELERESRKNETLEHERLEAALQELGQGWSRGQDGNGGFEPAKDLIRGLPLPRPLPFQGCLG